MSSRLHIFFDVIRQQNQYLGIANIKKSTKIQQKSESNKGSLFLCVIFLIPKFNRTYANRRGSNQEFIGTNIGT
jgi:hypothetical protein